tara:strand:- start:4682 stop:4891 length:210 start_codon:yes stop_codon:yes gene_type:complete
MSKRLSKIEKIKIIKRRYNAAKSMFLSDLSSALDLEETKETRDYASRMAKRSRIDMRIASKQLYRLGAI